MNQPTHKHVILQHWNGEVFSIPKYPIEQNSNIRVFGLYQVIGEVDVPYPPLGSQTLAQFYYERNIEAVRIWKEKEEQNA